MHSVVIVQEIMDAKEVQFPLSMIMPEEKVWLMKLAYLLVLMQKLFAPLTLILVKNISFRNIVLLVVKKELKEKSIKMAQLQELSLFTVISQYTQKVFTKLLMVHPNSKVVMQLKQQVGKKKKKQVQIIGSLRIGGEKVGDLKVQVIFMQVKKICIWMSLVLLLYPKLIKKKVMMIYLVKQEKKNQEIKNKIKLI